MSEEEAITFRDVGSTWHVDLDSITRGMLAYAALVAVVRGSCDGVKVYGEVVLGEDGVMEVRGKDGKAASVVLAAGLIPGLPGTCTLGGGQAAHSPSPLWWMAEPYPCYASWDRWPHESSDKEPM